MLGRLHPGLASSFSSTLIQLLLVTLQGAFQHRDNFTLRTVKICSHLVDQNSTVAVKLLTHVQLIVTPWTAAHQAALSFTISVSLLKLMSTKSVMPSNHLTLYRPLLLLPSIFPSIRVFFQWVSSWHQEHQLQHQSFHEYSRFISFRIDWFDLLAVQGTLKSLLQHHRIALG